MSRQFEARHCFANALLILVVIAGAVITGGCTRAKYRMAADADTYSILQEKSGGTNWGLPAGFSVTTDPRSRYFRGDNPDDPSLPTPSPVLYDYQMPSIPERDPNRFRVSSPELEGSEPVDPYELEPVPSGVEFIPPGVAYSQFDRPSELGANAYGPTPNSAIQRTVFDAGSQPSRGGDTAQGLWQAEARRQQQQPVDNLQFNAVGPTTPAAPIASLNPTIRPAAADLRRAPFQAPERFIQPGPAVLPNVLVHVPGGYAFPQEPDEAPSNDGRAFSQDSDDGPRLVAIPKEIWERLPPDCMQRMFEFESIREEYRRSFGVDPPPELRDDSPALALEDIIELSLLNSRDYQAQKESLYRVALRLTQERFAYDLKFSTGSNGTAANYGHSRNGGTTVNSLGVPTDASVDMALATGGDLLARFANDVVLTFNGPTGFTADVGSELLMNLTYNVFQRDATFERLTQAERDVLYAARDFARFRRSFFVQRASQYYSLIQTYRTIEIDSQNYLSLVRAFNEADAEYRATGARSRVDVDQFEQSALSGRRRLIGTCNGLEGSLDGLKLAMGLPPETPINLNLTELNELTLRDEITVTSELVARSGRVLQSERQRAEPDRAELLNGAVKLSERMLERLDILRSQNLSQESTLELETLIASLIVEESRQDVRFNAQVLDRERAAVPPAPPLRIYRRTMDLTDSILILVFAQLQLAELEGMAAEPLQILRSRHLALADQWQAITDTLDLTNIPDHIVAAEALLDDVQTLLADTDEATGTVILTPDEEMEQTLQVVDYLLARAQETSLASFGLVPIDLDMEEGMLTALVQRFDLMNERGDLADSWRQIKLAGDDLRSVLNLNATQRIRTEPNVNRGFDFTFDESSTSLSLSFDTPLNRRSQRNGYRSALINYQAALRNLIELEDLIKSDIRDDLRALQLGREQYQISVASAALAYERVVSTQLQLELATEGTTARDYLEAQSDYAASLNSVASEHIRYIQNRNQLFLDLEALVVDDQGFWTELYNESLQPEPRFGFEPSRHAPYGELPHRLRYSRDVRRMEWVPEGQATILDPTSGNVNR